MTLKNRLQILLLLSLSLAGCKKSEQTKPIQIEPVTVHSGAKSIEIVSGNNQYGYSRRPLPDTIVFKVTMNNPVDTAAAALNYYIGPNCSTYQFLVVGRTNVNGVIYLKAIWTPSTTATTASLTFYTHAGCSIDEINHGACKTLDSVKLSATIRKQWTSVYTGNQGGLNVLYDLHFTDANHGIAIGEGSGLVSTANGGKTWAQGPAPRSDNDMQLLAFSGPDTGLMVLVNNYVWFTYDGGKTYAQENWTPPFVGDRSSAAYDMLSRKVIYTVGWHGQIAKTTDGGLTWAQEGFSFLNNFHDLISIGNDTLYACGDVGKIVKTTNAGTTWHEQPLQLNNTLNALFFITNNFGFAGGQYGTLVRTTDGSNWSVVKTNLGFSIIAIRFFDALHGYIVTSGGEIAESKDGGLTWTMRCTDNYGVGSLNKAVIKDETTIYGLQQASIYTFDLTQP
ncbi:YCF48-related protein [Mucilaginibacter sp. BT774]|uniref:WD40/YVTN/BNR-like repeat-containing protein n=1 Tax=Mucilaginibacter sp. BT774 TaxID=3062276 RepID=UPI002676F9D0|nr:YCF48-related protein [Mucilaginibacter sp. BT774]MDO3625049.1 YCF48-related protein [Mucilaginibacter sp. BT774]